MNEPAFSAQLRRDVVPKSMSESRAKHYEAAYEFSMANAETQKYGALRKDKNAKRLLKAEKNRLYDEFKQNGKYGFIEWISIAMTIWTIISKIVEWLYARNHPEVMQSQFKEYYSSKGA